MKAFWEWLHANTVVPMSKVKKRQLDCAGCVLVETTPFMYGGLLWNLPGPWLASSFASPIISNKHVCVRITGKFKGCFLSLHMVNL